jgi:DNA repair protein RadC
MNHSIKQSIKAWPQQERPRERLLEQGASSLSDAELLAIFLRSGSRQHSAVELARLLIQHFGDLILYLTLHRKSCVSFMEWARPNIHN